MLGIGGRMCFTQRMPRRGFRYLLSACLFVAVLGSGLSLTRPAHAQSLVGKRAPEFHIDGIFNEAYSLEKFKGHILVLQFGSSW